MQEIYVSSTFTLVVSFTHLLFVGWYLVSTLFIRTLGQSFFNGYINYTVARGSCCVIPTYNLIIVFIGWKMLNLLESKRISKVQSTIEIKSTGAEGVKNYEEAIWKHWDTVSSGLSKV
uniref:Uncharacterized protein n=1 Tax=Caenorhabditis japonica TaxID=281687 RepID=A0A8R1DME0_CAEJA